MSCMPCPSLGKKCATTPNKLKNPLRLSTSLFPSLFPHLQFCALSFKFYLVTAESLFESQN